MDDRNEAMEEQHNEEEDGEGECHIMLEMSDCLIAYSQTTRIVELGEEEGGDGEQRHGLHGEACEKTGQEDGERSGDGTQFANATSDRRGRG